jgi:murein DD-endopeptidase MepM/ murein hydrolase activator NlpD
MSRFQRHLLSLLLCIVVTIFSVTLARAQSDAQPPEPPPPAPTPPAPTPDIDWAAIRLPPHDPPLATESAPPTQPEIVIEEIATPDPAESISPKEPAAVIDESGLPDPAVVTEAGANIYIVKRGDSLFRIARSFGVSQTRLASYNNLDNPSLIFPGQTLHIPTSDMSPSPPKPDPLPVSGNVYVVQRGDVLYRIARRFGVTVQALVAANNIADPQRIYPGTILEIPDSSGAQPASTPTPAPTPTSTPSPPADGQTTYTVQRGDSLHRIARRFGLTVEALARANQLQNWWLIYPGQVLLIPAPTDPPPTPAPISGDTPYIWPVDSRAIVKGYRAGHRAIDIVVPTGTPVLAIADGVVEFAGWNRHGYGYLVVVDHGNGVRSLYAHHDSLVVVARQQVAQGEIVGLSGNTGNSSMPHLHLEIRINSNLVNPCLHLPGGC